jgi:hypothetical protein
LPLTAFKVVSYETGKGALKVWLHVVFAFLDREFPAYDSIVKPRHPNLTPPQNGIVLSSRSWGEYISIWNKGNLPRDVLRPLELQIRQLVQFDRIQYFKHKVVRRCYGPTP